MPLRKRDLNDVTLGGEMFQAEGTTSLKALLGSSDSGKRLPLRVLISLFFSYNIPLLLSVVL